MEVEKMKSVKLVFFLLSFSHLSLSATLIVDPISHWNHPTVQLGDNIKFYLHPVFRHNYKLYIFQNRRAFNLCNFTQATLLTKSNQTSFTWHPSRLGLFYFSFNNGSTKACQDGQKLAIEVYSSMPPQISVSSPLQPPTEPPKGPTPTLGGIVSSSPTYPWPFGPRKSTPPSPSPSSVSFTASSPSIVPVNGDVSIPFISSNPVVPLPTGEIDSASIRPVPTSSNHRVQMVGFQAVLRTVCCVFFILLL